MSLPPQDALAIQRVVALHGHLVDAGELDRLDEVFTEDVRYDLSALGGGVLVGLDAVRDAALQLGDRNPIAHHVTNTLVEEAEGGARAPSKYLGVRADGGVGSGVYDDVVSRTPSGWRIAARRVSVRRQPLAP